MHIYMSQFPIYWGNGVLSHVNLISRKMLNPMNIELKYIGKYSLLHLVLTQFWSSLQSQINLIQRTVAEKPFPWKPLCWERSQNIPSEWDNLIVWKLLQWKGHFKFRKQIPQQLGNCVEHFVSMFLVFQPTLLEAHQSHNLLEYLKLNKLDRNCQILIFKTCQAMNLILWHH